jgi:hypothetical protein
MQNIDIYFIVNYLKNLMLIHRQWILTKADKCKTLFDDIDSLTKTDPTGAREKKAHVQKQVICLK